MPLWMKLEAVLLYMSGMSMNAIAALLAVSAQSILNWVRDFAQANDEKSQSEGEVVVVAEPDEMWHFIQSKKIKCGSGRHLIVLVGDSSTGKLEIAMLKSSK